MKYEAVIFDLFGTLVDNIDYEEYMKILRQVASILAVLFDDFMRLWSETSRQRSLGAFTTIEDNFKYICEKMGVDHAGTQIKLATGLRNDFIAHSMEPQPDAEDVLSRLKLQGLKLGLISNCTPETPVFWEKLPFARLFDVTVFSCLAGMQKPEPGIYELVVKQLSVKPENCLYVGDGNGRELSGAKDAGMQPVLIRHAGEDGTQPHLVNREECDPRISSLSEILALLND